MNLERSINAVSRAGILALIALGVCVCVPPLLRAQTLLYWDTNGTTAGAGATPSGTWAKNNGNGKNWSTSSTGTVNTSGWQIGATAIFSAGTDATGSYTVTTTGTPDVADIRIEEGNPTFTGTAINFVNATATIDIAAGSTATFSTGFTGAGTTLTKSGAGNLTFGTGVNLSTTNLVLSGGTLNLGGFTSTFGSLAVTANSVLDFGGGASILNLNSVAVSSGVTLTVTNWANAVDYFYSTNDPGSANLSGIVFAGYTGSNASWQAFDHQIAPVPEPSVYGAVLLGLSTLFAGWRLHRRRTA